MSRYVCGACGCAYEEEKGDESQGVPAGTPFDALPNEWACPECGSTQDLFEETDE